MTHYLLGYGKLDESYCETFERKFANIEEVKTRGRNKINNEFHPEEFFFIVIEKRWFSESIVYKEHGVKKETKAGVRIEVSGGGGGGAGAWHGKSTVIPSQNFKMSNRIENGVEYTPEQWQNECILNKLDEILLLTMPKPTVKKKPTKKKGKKKS